MRCEVLQYSLRTVTYEPYLTTVHYKVVETDMINGHKVTEIKVTNFSSLMEAAAASMQSALHPAT